MSSASAEPPYKVELTTSAARQARKLPRKIGNQIRGDLERLASDPRGAGVAKLTNVEAYRLRSGDYRIVFLVEDRSRRILVVLIAHRSAVYERLRRMKL